MPLHHNPGKPFYLSLILLSASVIAFQLGLLQYLSILQWHHFAYMVISIALLGFGASGTILSLFRQRLRTSFTWLAPLLMVGTGVTMIGSVYLCAVDSLRFDSWLLFTSFNQPLRFVLTLLILLIPFLLAALAIGLSFDAYPSEIGRLYCANLIGSGLGGVLALIMSSYLMPASILILTSLPAMAGGVLLGGRKWRLATLILLVSSVALVWAPPPLKVSEYKDLSKVLTMPGARITFQSNSSHGLVQVAEAPALRPGICLSLVCDQTVPECAAVHVNSNGVGMIWPRSESSAVLNYTTDEFPYAFAASPNVLVLDAGAGRGVVHALSHQPKRVVAVEAIPALNTILEREFSNDVIIRREEALSFLRRSDDEFDLIILPHTNVFGGNAGLQALQTQPLLTVQGFDLMLNRLSGSGMISVTCWWDHPPRHPLRLLALLRQALVDRGVDRPQDHIAAIASWGTITFVLRKTPFPKTATGIINDFCRPLQFDPILVPGLAQVQTPVFNTTQDPTLFRAMNAILAGNDQDYPFNIGAPTADCPFFRQFLKWSSVHALTQSLGARNFPFVELGFVIIVLTLVVVSVAAVILIVLPLVALTRLRPRSWWVLLYFGALGMGYMFTEIVLIQAFISYLGNAVTSSATVISVMLVASGAGSFLSKRMTESGRLLRILVIIVSLLLCVAVTFRQIIALTFGLPLAARFGLVGMLVAVPAFFMGMPFPHGLSILGEKSPDQLPWGWGINGCFSVISSVLAALIAVEIGFSAVLIGAAAAYCVAALVCSNL